MRNEYKNYLLDFNGCYVQFDAAIDLDVYFLGFQIGKIRIYEINNIDGKMGTKLNKYFKDFQIDLKAKWCSVENSIYSEGHWFETGTRARRIRDMIKNDIPAIISVGPAIIGNGIRCYDMDKSVPSNGLSFVGTDKELKNHYFTVTAIIHDEIKERNGDFYAIMYVATKLLLIKSQRFALTN